MAHKRLAALAAAVVTLGTVAPAMAGTTAPPTGDSHISGRDRYEVSANISKGSFSPSVDLVTIASGAVYTDALAGGAIAANAQGPVLLTQANVLPASVRAELVRLKPQAVLIAGSTGSVSIAVQNAIQAAVPQAAIFRDGGKDRYSTAAAMSADYYVDGASTVYIASGRVYSDAVSAVSPAGLSAGPLLYADTSLPAATRDELVRLKNKGTVETVIVLGGPATVSEPVFNQISSIFGKASDGYPVTARVAGANRYAVGVSLARLLWGSASLPAAKAVYYASGTAWADAVAVGPAAAANDAPALLTGPACMPTETRNWTQQNSGTVKSRVWVGGSAKPSTTSC